MQTVNILREVLEEPGDHPCVSVIVPTHRRSPDRSTDRLRIEKALMQAKTYLQGNYQHDIAIRLQASLDELLFQVDPVHSQDGLGFFVAPGYSRLVQFYMPVNERVVVGTSFLVRDLLYDAHYGQAYLTLQLSEKDIRLFKGQFSELAEVQDTHFPMVYEEQYEYSKPARGLSASGQTFVKGIERDRSQLEKIRLGQFFHQADQILDNYLQENRLLVVAGAERDLGSFKHVTKHTRDIAGWLPGHYGHPGDKLYELSWSAVKKYMDQQIKATVTGSLESNKGRLVTGLVDCWNAIEEGRGQELMVERDYTQAAFLSTVNGREALCLRPPKGRHTILPDVINELMIRMLKKGGAILQVDNDCLRLQGRVALHTRY